jgi:hypothetical protein
LGRSIKIFRADPPSTLTDLDIDFLASCEVALKKGVNHAEANKHRIGHRCVCGSFGNARRCGSTKGISSEGPDRVLLGQQQVEQLLLLMDTDKNGRISKKEWMDYMSAEFDLLDTDKNGELDVMEISQSRLQVGHPINVGK